MGFAAASARTKTPEILISAALSSPDPDAAAAAVKAGADFLLVTSADVTADADKLKALGVAASVPCGLRLSRPSPAAVAEARELGFDYLCVGDQDTPAAAFLDDEIGFVLAVAEDSDDSALQILQSTSFDALHAGELVGSPTLRRQLALRRMSVLARKPLFLDVRDTLDSQDLECLRDAGVAALVTEVKGRSASRITGLRQAIGAMKPRRKARNERESTALLPSVSHAADGDDDDDE
jgi:hypothetical protein